jgi:hypothetical protein
MKIWHRIGFSDKDAVDPILDAIGIKYKKWPLPGGFYGITFDIAESDHRWEQVAELVKMKGASDIVQTVFSKKELLSAEWVRLIPVFEQGYPQPEETWVTNPINYEEHCPQCGTFRQTGSFRLKKEPNLGKKDFMSLYWTYALFCTPRVLSELEAHEIQGYEVWDAIIHKTGTPSEKVSQLFIPHLANPGLVRVENLKRETCSLCHVTKYYPHMRGVMYLKRDALVSDVDIMQTHEWFGSGHAAYREILVSNKLVKLIIDKDWKGVALKVVELV